MQKLNNHGQTLVIFVLILPLLFMIIGVIVEMSNITLTRQKYESATIETIEYGLDHLDNEDVKAKMNKMLEANIKGTKEITIDNQKITIRVTDKMDGSFKKLFKDAYKIDIKYTGFIENDTKKIEKN